MFDAAAEVLVKEPERLPNLPENELFSARQLVRDLRCRGVSARFFDKTDDILEYLAETARQDDVIVVMSNGGFDNIHVRLLDRLA